MFAGEILFPFLNILQISFSLGGGGMPQAFWWNEHDSCTHKYLLNVIRLKVKMERVVEVTGLKCPINRS